MLNLCVNKSFISLLLLENMTLVHVKGFFFLHISLICTIYLLLYIYVWMYCMTHGSVLTF